jgi:hypothetical protein
MLDVPFPPLFLTRKLEIKKAVLFLKQMLHVKNHISSFLAFLFNTSACDGERATMIHRPRTATSII